MAVFHIVLGNNAVILDPFLRKKIYSIGFLQKGIPNVLLISQNLFQDFRPPSLLPSRCQNAIQLQTLSNLGKTCSLQIFPVNPLYDFCFLRLYNQPPFLILGISKKTVVVNLNPPLLVTVLQSKFYILA